ncbi:MAG: hypothetical protein Ct9H300mP4_05120 [Gammaproteobacteria bacterium]|nr:MAG: hypothetical protein Ct9H300mP4_05120 [Gammaproteobacteria bacterium]
MHTRENKNEAVYTDYIHPLTEINVDYAEGSTIKVDLHNGGKVILNKAQKNYSPIDRSDAIRGVRESNDKGEILTGLLYIDENQSDFIENENTVETPLNELSFQSLCPGSGQMAELQKRYK